MADNDPVVFDEHSAKLIEAAVKRALAQLRNPRPPADVLPVPLLPAPGRWLPFINEANEEIPAYACMRVTGSTFDDDDGVIILKCDKPSTIFTTDFVFNGGFAVPSASEASEPGGGLCTYGPWAVVACDTASTAANGDKFGPKPGEWRLFKGWPDVATIAGPHVSTDQQAIARVHEVDSVIGKTTVDVGTNSTGTLLVWTSTSDSDEAVSSPLLKVGFRNRTSTVLPSSSFIQVFTINGRSFGVPWEC